MMMDSFARCQQRQGEGAAGGMSVFRGCGYNNKMTGNVRFIFWRRILPAVALVLLATRAIAGHFPSFLAPVRAKLLGARTLDRALEDIDPGVKKSAEDSLISAGCQIPAQRLAFLAMKEEKSLEAWCMDAGGNWRFIKEYKVQAASGGPGPKLREGDLQVPEGIYPIEGLNPNSRFHLSMKVGYPNKFDREMARRDNRKNLGGDIFIHGSHYSIGCLAMGDGPIEEIFYMTARTGHSRTQAIIIPWDFRKKPPSAPAKAPSWTDGLYRELARAVAEYHRKD